MKYLYNIGIHLYTTAITIAAAVNTKARLWCEGRKGLLRRIEEQHGTHTKRRMWIHVASLGEFEQARPIIEHIRKEQREVEIIVTFFSPSGYEIRKDFALADAVHYLPADTPHNARRFIETLKPDIAIFIKYEFWLNYLSELRKRNIATFLVAATFRKESIFFKPWGKLWREALKTYSTIFVQNDTSVELLRSIGIESAVVAGDTRFDRVMAIAKEARQLPVIEAFRGARPLLVAGSTWPKDEELIAQLAKENRDVKIVIAPHEIDTRHVDNIIARCEGKAIHYTACDDTTRYDDYQILVLDTMGMLSAVYRYARWAYIGGGFGAGIHNTLEAAVYGLPIAFGPRYQKFNEATEMISRGIAHSISDYDELRAWFRDMKDEDMWHSVHHAAERYTSANCGATERICKVISSE